MLPAIKTFFGSLFGNTTFIFIAIIIGITALIIIPNSDAVLERFGFETRASLKADKENLKNAMEDAIKVNEGNVNAIKTADEIKDISKAAGNAVSNHITKVETKVTASETKHQQAVKKAQFVKTKPGTQHNPTLPAPEVIEQVSEANITLIWDVYNDVKTS
jgi:hypothetical protein